MLTIGEAPCVSPSGVSGVATIVSRLSWLVESDAVGRPMQGTVPMPIVMSGGAFVVDRAESSDGAASSCASCGCGRFPPLAADFNLGRRGARRTTSAAVYGVI
jgi:hypothetical protein